MNGRHSMWWRMAETSGEKDDSKNRIAVYACSKATLADMRELLDSDWRPQYG